jgi:hypothetical protein
MEQEEVLSKKSGFGMRNVAIIVAFALLLVVAAQIQRNAKIDSPINAASTPSKYDLPPLEDLQKTPATASGKDQSMANSNSGSAVLGATNYSSQYQAKCGNGAYTTALPRSAEDPNIPC